MKATLIYRNRRVLADGSIEEIVIWKLPEVSPDRPHGFKFRLYYGLADGKCLVRYDNEKGKPDHKHFPDNEEFYVFVSIEQLMEDFMQDIKRAREGVL